MDYSHWFLHKSSRYIFILHSDSFDKIFIPLCFLKFSKFYLRYPRDTLSVD